jgi:cysteinyl-tRNA synthetase
MSEATLGSPFEIHGGGNDLIFPHHENEAAQTKAARGHELAQIWMHNGMIEMGGKMSKSIGNIRSLADVLDLVGRDTLLMYFAEGHYRQPLAFSQERLDDAARRVEGIRNAGRRLVPGDSPEALAPHRDAFFDALADDYNTPRALAALAEWIREANSADAPVGDAHAREMLAMLGLENLLDADEGAPPEIVDLAQQRGAARAARDFAEADRLRDELRSRGWEVRDGPQGAELIPIGP